MKTLLIMRHAKSSWDDPELPDHDRPLNKRGKRDAPRMGRLMREKDLTPDQILCSTAARAQATARSVSQECGFQGEILVDPVIYHGDPEAILHILSELPDNCQTALLVGHNPDLEELLETVTEEYHHLTTAALAHVELPLQSWQDLDELVQGSLVDLWRPRDLI